MAARCVDMNEPFCDMAAASVDIADACCDMVTPLRKPAVPGVGPAEGSRDAAYLSVDACMSNIHMNGADTTNTEARFCVQSLR